MYGPRRRGRGASAPDLTDLLVEAQEEDRLEWLSLQAAAQHHQREHAILRELTGLVSETRESAA